MPFDAYNLFLADALVAKTTNHQNESFILKFDLFCNLTYSTIILRSVFHLDVSSSHGLFFRRHSHAGIPTRQVALHVPDPQRVIRQQFQTRQWGIPCEKYVSFQPKGGGGENDAF